ncbi:glycoside hydrolase family 55 protein [Cadophora sp. DSE1049]|nr:glycoside hydrolase family 55 protein [Cadophora sp. DSE1049]
MAERLFFLGHKDSYTIIYGVWPPQRPPSLLDGSDNIFACSKPTYGNLGAGSFVVATDTCNNMSERDQSDNINRLLANNVGKPIYFPSDVYLVEKTIEIPVNTIIVGELWPQIMDTGDLFSDENNPQRVGKSGDSGIVVISDMLFSVKGPTRGAIMMEWNVHESTQGSAAMWDSHFRVGGGYFSDLTIEQYPKSTADTDRNCMAALLYYTLLVFHRGIFKMFGSGMWLMSYISVEAVPRSGPRNRPTPFLEFIHELTTCWDPAGSMEQVQNTIRSPTPEPADPRYYDDGSDDPGGNIGVLSLPHIRLRLLLVAQAIHFPQAVPLLSQDQP